MTPYDAGKPLAELAAELGLPELVRLAANENPLGPSPHVLDAIAREAARVHLYPDGGAVALRDALARRLGVRPGQLVVGNGADELIGLVALAAFEPGDEVVVPQPSFEPYATSVVLAGARAVLSPLAGYETDLDDIDRKSTRLNSSHTVISYAVFCLKKKKRMAFPAGLRGRADRESCRVAAAQPG